MPNPNRSALTPVTFATVYTPECFLITPLDRVEVRNIEEIMGTCYRYFTKDEAMQFQENAKTTDTRSIHFYPETGDVAWHHEHTKPSAAVILEKGFREVGLFSSLMARLSELEKLPLRLAVHGIYPTQHMDADSVVNNITEIVCDASPGTTDMIQQTLLQIYKKIAPDLSITFTENEISVEVLPILVQAEDGLVEGEFRLNMDILKDSIAGDEVSPSEFN